jgi:hypothetical protein
MQFSLRGHWVRTWFLFILAFIFSTAVKWTDCDRQTNVNLRRDPSASEPPLRLLVPPEELRRLSPTQVNRYYNVATDANEEGWVWGTNIDIGEGRQVAIL